MQPNSTPIVLDPAAGRDRERRRRRARRLGTGDKDSYREQRRYPEGSLFADITGYYDQVDEAATGLEAEYDSYLKLHTSPREQPA